MTSQATEWTRRYADVLRAANRSERTIDSYLYSLKGFDRFLGERPLGEATPQEILGYQVDVAARGLSDSTIRVATYSLLSRRTRSSMTPARPPPGVSSGAIPTAAPTATRDG